MTSESTIRPSHFRSLAALIFLLARLPEMTTASPWVDEAANWALSSHEASLWPPTHFLTYASQSAALALADSLVALRLPSLLFSLAAYLLLCEWVWRRIGSEAAVAFALLFSLSPIGIFYSIDANHYGALLLAGTLILLGLSPESPRWRWAAVGAASVGALAAPKFHPLGAFLSAAWGLALCVWLVGEAPRLARGRLDPGRARLLAVLAGLAAAAVAFAVIDPLGRMGERASEPHREERLPGFSLDFWLPLLGDYYGRLFHHRPLDIAAGLLGAATSLAGWGLLLRRWRVRRVALAGGCLVLCLVGPFLVLYFSTFFYPKFWVPLLPVLLLGNAAFLAAAVRGGAGMRLAGGAFAVLFCLCAGLFQLRMVTHDYQPAGQLLAHVAEEFPGGTLLASRIHYSSRALGFLADHPRYPAVDFLALDPLEYAPGPAIQQLEEAAWESSAPVLFASLLETRERNSRDFTRWLEENTTLLATFESLAVDDFIPFDRSLHLRRVERPARSPFALPRDGSRASALLGTRHIEGREVLHGSFFLLPAGTGARWNVDLDGAARGAGIDLHYRLEGRAAVGSLLLFHFSSGAAFAVAAGQLEERGVITLPGPLEGPDRQAISLVAPIAVDPSRTGGFLFAPLEIAPAAGSGDGVLATELKPLSTREGEPRITSEARGRGVLPGGTVSLEGRPPGRGVVLLQRLHPRGLANTGVRTVVRGGGGERAVLSLGVERTIAPVLAGAALHPAADTEELSWELRSFRMVNEVYYDPVLEYWEPMVYLLPEVN